MTKGGVAALLGAAAWVPAASAQEVTLKPLLDARLRYESVDQDGFAEEAHAVTTRVRSGVEATRGRWSLLGDVEATLAIDGRYFDGVRGDPHRPLVADPQNVELDRLQLRYAAKTGSVTAGRQRIDLADQRFVASAPFRQNEQTFDAVRGQWSGVPHLAVDLTYARAVRTINGVNGRGARPTAIDGDSVFALAGYQLPVGTLTGFTYLVDLDAAAVQGFRLSSQTYGARFAGKRSFSGAWSLGYAASWARQGDYRRNPNRYRADYWLGEASLTRRAVTGTLGYEVLGADRGAALTSFQTPLAALFKFQGWADKFTTTPPDGVRDLYVTGTTAWKPGGRIGAVTLSATWHRFESDRLVRHYGNEVDLLASAKLGRTTFAARYARYARYRADRFATDTDKFWLSADWSL